MLRLINNWRCMLEILLIQPRTSKARRIVSSHNGVMPPMMLAYLAAPLVNNGFDVEILDLTVSRMNAEALKEYLRRHRPALVGITCTTASYYNALKIAGCVRETLSDTRVVMGGPHVTFTARETMGNDCVDVVVRGEGDISFTRLAEHLLRGKYSLPEIRGITYRRDGKIEETPTEMIMDIDALPLPAREKLDMKCYPSKGVIQASRGCPFRCIFCAATAMQGGKYRTRNVDSIKDEIDYLVKDRGIDYLVFIDDTLTIFPELSEAICTHIINRGYRLNMTFQSRADFNDPKLLALMARAGCTMLQFGFESGSESVLKSIRKRITPAHIEKAARACLDAGMNVYGTFILGFPEETVESLEETAAMIRRVRSMGAGVGLGLVTPLPGTYLYTHAEELGITIHSTDWDDYGLDTPIVSTRYLSVREIQAKFFDMQMELTGPAYHPL
jgi:anaerobic magnesium-protoporphyrin IX monomethyl ester cyclase